MKPLIGKFKFTDDDLEDLYDSLTREADHQRGNLLVHSQIAPQLPKLACDSCLQWLSKCAVATRIAFGRGRSFATQRKKSRAGLGWIAVIGEPCETKREGMRSDRRALSVLEFGH